MIKLENVHKSFGDQKVLQGYTLQVKEGESFVVVGRSGIGKSVTLKHIVGILQPDEGRVIIDGQDITRADRATLYQVRHKVAYLFQSGALINWMTVGENVELPLREHTDFSASEIREIAMEHLSHVSMVDAYDKYPAQISGGMKKRAALARVLAQEPRIILYDEPTSGLDPIMATNIAKLIKKVQKKFYVTSIMVCHNLTSAYYVADRIGVHHKGRIVYTGSPQEFQNSDHPLVQSFIRGEELNNDQE